MRTAGSESSKPWKKPDGGGGGTPPSALASLRNIEGSVMAGGVAGVNPQLLSRTTTERARVWPVASDARARSRRATGDAAEGDPVVLARLVFETASALRRAVVPSVEREHGFPQQSLEVLLRLSQAEGGRLRMSDLATQTLLTPSGLTRAIDRLCEAGLVHRQTCSEDRRGSFASLTPEGSSRMAAAMSCHRTAVCELLGEALDPSEQRRLVALLLRLRDRLGCDASA